MSSQLRCDFSHPAARRSALLLAKTSGNKSMPPGTNIMVSRIVTNCGDQLCKSEFWVAKNFMVPEQKSR